VKAAAGIKVMFHLAAGIDKSFAGCFMNSVLTTRNLLDAAVSEKVLKRFVNVSSFAVYSTVGMRRGSLLDESAPLETEPMRRQDPYGYGKLKQEQIVERYHQTFGVPYVILRPGTVYGPGKSNLSGRIGIDTFGVFLHMGGSKRLPLTYVDNCADAIVLAGLVEGVEGQVFNVVDDEQPTSGRFLRLYRRHVGRFLSIPVPYPVAYLLCAAWEDYARRSEGQLPAKFNRRRCSAEWKGNRYSNERLKSMLGWVPRVSLDQGSQLLFDFLRATK
jgi:nucleoside-diphosphate-sugar epimerase